jgi:hypothetical protein
MTDKTATTQALEGATLFPKPGADPDLEEAAIRALDTISRRAESHTAQRTRLLAAPNADEAALARAETSFATGDFLYGLDAFLVTLPDDATVAQVRTAIFNHLRLTGRHMLR